MRLFMIRLANPPTPHLTKVAQSTSHTSLVGFADYGVRPQAAPASDGVKFQPDIRPADWDALFQAIQTRLETCVSQALTRLQNRSSNESHAATFQAVLECVADMRQLHTALIQDRMAQQGNKIYAGN